MNKSQHKEDTQKKKALQMRHGIHQHQYNGSRLQVIGQREDWFPNATDGQSNKSTIQIKQVDISEVTLFF